MTEDSLDTMGPIDYIVIEWPGNLPNGEALPHLIDLVERGIVHIIDLAFIAKDEDGNIAVLNLDEAGADLAVFEGAATGILGDDDIAEAGSAIEPGTAAAVLIWENTWAAPFATALRKNGGQLVASGRIPVQALLASLEATEATAGA
ncbi:MAG: DUF6325 family protein [Solirubrobacterales bacterium]